MSKIMSAEEWIKKFHPNTETFNVARLELELKAYAHYYHSQMTAPQDGFIKVEHFPTGENNSKVPEWLASIPSMAGVAESGKTKDEAVNEVLISLCVKAAHETGTSPAILDSLRQEKDKWTDEDMKAIASEAFLKGQGLGDGNFNVTAWMNEHSRPLPPVQR